MDVPSNALATAASHQPARWTPVVAARLAVLGVVVVAALLLWVIALATPLVAFLMAVALACGWCLWLEKYPEPSVGNETRPHPIASEHKIF